VTELPLRERVWADTGIALVNGSPALRMRDVFTDGEVAIEGDPGARMLRVAEVFAEFPVAVLLAV
jgi:hypothetical protein